MAYGYNYFGQPAYYPQPVQQMPPAQPPQQVQTAQNQSSGIVWVHGENDARSYLVAAGTSVLLMDADESVFYIKSTDTSGMPQPLRIFDYKERTAAAPTHADTCKYVTHEELEAKLAKLMEVKDNG